MMHAPSASLQSQESYFFALSSGPLAMLSNVTPHAEASDRQAYVHQRLHKRMRRFDSAGKCTEHWPMLQFTV